MYYLQLLIFLILKFTSKILYLTVNDIFILIYIYV